MADVKFDNSTYTFDALEQKYRNFFAPAFEVTIDGTNLTRQSVAISSITVNTITKNEADSVSFTVENAYDPIRREFQWTDSLLAIGKYMTVKMGYTDKLETVFYGIITTVDLDFPAQGNPTIQVQAMDASFFMTKGTHSNTWLKKKDSDVVKAVGAKYGLRMVVDDTVVEKETIEQSETTDFLFLSELAQMNHFDFFVVGKTLYFRKPKQSKVPVMTLMYGKNLRSFSTTIDLSGQVSQVVVRGYDKKTLEPIEATSRNIDIIGNNSRTGRDIMRSLADYTKQYYYTNSGTLQEAQHLADAIMNEIAMDLIKGQGESIGIPEMRAGRYLKLDGLGSKFNQVLYLTRVTHTISASGYLTTFVVEGNAI
ncbi:phage late control D family protein [Paenibacillus aurantiacus]|uniref:Phage late control D family protein n=1 Tax=Paenibacillus aurantiacus TaxID=1936118 RepID=A0ABV5KXZ4_9BACL